MKAFNSGDVVQVTSGSSKLGSLWIVEKHIKDRVMVYNISDGVLGVVTHFPAKDLSRVGEGALVIPERCKS